MKKFEYNVFLHDDKGEYEINEDLNDLGKEGWELVSTVYVLGGYRCFLKREIIQK